MSDLDKTSLYLGWCLIAGPVALVASVVVRGSDDGREGLAPTARTVVAPSALPTLALNGLGGVVQVRAEGTKLASPLLGVAQAAARPSAPHTDLINGETRLALRYSDCVALNTDATSELLRWPRVNQ